LNRLPLITGSEALIEQRREQQVLTRSRGYSDSGGGSGGFQPRIPGGLGPGNL